MTSFILSFKFDEFNVLEFIASVLVTLIFTITVYYLKPKLKIICACWDNEQRKIKIKVENNGHFDAVNLSMEVCAYNEKSKQTIHLKLEHMNFLFYLIKNPLIIPRHLKL